MSLLCPPNQHHLSISYTIEFSCQHEVQPWLRLKQFLCGEFTGTLPKAASQCCGSLKHSHSWPASIFPAKQRFYFSVTSLLLITADFSASANQITQILHPHDLLKPLFSSETPQARHLLSALLSTLFFFQAPIEELTEL